MSETPPLTDTHPLPGRDRTPELTTKREKRHREDDEEDDRDRSDRSHRHRRDEGEPDRDRERERRHRHRHREEETEEERRERHRRRYEEETESDREERRKRRREREMRDRERGGRDYDDRRRGSRDISVGHHSTHRDRSRESHRSHRSRDVDIPAIKEMTREEKEAERERRDREMAEERREAARRREERFAEMDRERVRDRRMRDPSPPRRRRPSPNYEGGPARDPATALLDEVDSESRSVFVSQLSAKMTSRDLGLFFEDKLGRGAVRDARVVTDKVSRRSKGAIVLSGTIVMGIPINIMLTEAERNRQGQAAALASAPGATGVVRPPITFGTTFPPLSTGLALPPGVDADAHRDAAIPFHRLFISNLAFSLTADDLRQVFEPFGEIEFVDLHMDFAQPTSSLRSSELHKWHLTQWLTLILPVDQTVQDRAYVATEQIEETGGYGTRLDANQRQQLMYKLARTEPNVNLALSAPKPVVQSKSPSMNPTPYIIVSNMFNPEEETERNWDLDLAEDVKGEVEGKYGKVQRIKVDKMSAGEVYIEFAEIDGATQAIKGLNGRFFGGRQLQATYISEALFKAHL
ncbi:hypothetical protein CI109_103460 [Kwoniella shandongensis]|uniref:RRM domain-containing protein n=1 Tax=Kwoniella shandongensis TaxID=1734106 RepID=A0AAJ8LGV8_9TREE